VRFAAKQKPHRPGIAPALGLRAGSAVSSWSSRTSARQNPFPWILPRPVRRTDMNALLRLAVAVAVVLPLTVLGCFGFRFASNNDGNSLVILMRGIHREEELERSRHAVLRLHEFREQLAREVIAQRCSLKEAVACLQELDGEFDRDRPASFPKRSEIRARKWSAEVEGNYQYIIAKVKDLLRGRPEEAAAVLRRLEKDYQQLQTNTQTPSTAPRERPEPSR
jgi:hypothetical protein